MVMVEFTIAYTLHLLELSSMAVARAGEASSSTTRSMYDVFLSFRGEDTRKNFTDHLYTALVQTGLRTFRDNEAIERGETIKSELQNAIQQSRSSIIVFSKDFASSKWCLDELVRILECRKKSKLIVVPVFHDIDPSHIRKQTGKIGKALLRHEEKFKKDTDERKKYEWVEKMSQWRKSLTEVADLAGMPLRNQADGHEAKFIQKIVKVIKDKLNRIVLNIARHPIGIDFRTEDINLWLRDGSTSVGIVAICGMGGIGKTTIAKHAYNLNCENFEGSSFLANIGQISKQDNGLVRLQRQLLSDILRRGKEKISNVDEGIVKIKDAILCKRILLVMDDVDQPDQLEAILGMKDWMYPGSKIIITTRNMQLLKPYHVQQMEVKKLYHNESLKLFSLHAFGQDHPVETFMEHSERIVHHCGGLPLALKVLGSSLSGRSVDVWENAFKKLEAIPDYEIHQKLRLSYDSLQDDHDKNLFLDIACFFVGKDKDFTVTILDACEFFTTVGIDNLISRCLLTIDKYNKKLMMHQSLQDMGREIVRQESLKEPGKRSRLWHHTDSFNVLRKKTGTETIEGLAFNTHFLEAIRNSNEVVLEMDAFARMHKLRLLQLSNVQLAGCYKGFPRNLKWLCWHPFHLKSIPSYFPLESLVALEMQHSNLKQFGQGTKLLGLLKILDLSHSYSLAKTPDFSELPNLERLILEDCTSLIQIHESIGNLDRLVFLNLKDCKNLKTLSRNIGMLKYLETLDISGCLNLDEPLGLQNMESLRVLIADGTDINRLLSTTEEVKRCHAFFKSHVWKPVRSPEISWTLPCSLVSLSLQGCNLHDDAFPGNLNKLFSLMDLNLSENPISRLPDCVIGFNSLRRLDLSFCRKLQSLVGLPHVHELNVRFCTSLETISFQEPWDHPRMLYWCQCTKVVELNYWFMLKPIGEVDTTMIDTLGLSNLESMGNVEVNFIYRWLFRAEKHPIQGLHEYGIFSILIPGGEVHAGWFSNRIDGSSISFTAAPQPNLRIRGLNVYSLCSLSNSQDIWWPPPLFIKVSNKTKDLTWIHGPTFFGIPEDGEDMIWLTHWKFGNNLEGGDEVNVSIVVDMRFQVKECGFKLVYEEEQIMGTQDNYPCSSWPYDTIRGSTVPKDNRVFDLYESRHCHPTYEGSLTNFDWTRTEWFKNLYEGVVEAPEWPPIEAAVQEDNETW